MAQMTKEATTTVFTSEPFEKVVGVTLFRDGVIIATTGRVLFYGPKKTAKELAVKGVGVEKQGGEGRR